MGIKRVKVLGERNSGTRYLEKLIKTNLNVKLLDFKPPKWYLKSFMQLSTLNSFSYILHSPISLGWKHAIPYKAVYSLGFSRNAAQLSLVKNPYSFLLSLYKRPYYNPQLKELSFSQFLRSEFKTVLKENHSSNFENPIKLWNSKNVSFIELSQIKKHSKLIKYEELLADPEMRIREIASEFGITSKQNTFVNIESSTKSKNKDYSFYQRYYLDKKWLESYSEADIRWVNGQLDKDLMRKIGYEIVNPNSVF